MSTTITKKELREYFPRLFGLSLSQDFVTKNCDSCEKLSHICLSDGEYQAVFCRGPKKRCRKQEPGWLGGKRK